ncbi:MAG: FliM/FliN family flagellar motor switch protein [Hyphomicrobium sp.]
MATEASTLAPPSGRPIELALRAGPNNPERLPGLMTILRQLPNEIIEECKTAVYVLPRAKILDVVSLTYEEIAAPAGGVMAVLWSERWKNHIYCTADSAAALLFIDVALGGEQPSSSQSGGRAYTKSESYVLEILFKRIARALTNAFSICVDVKFEVVEVAGNVDDELLCRPETPVIFVKLAIEWLGATGSIGLILPQPALESVRETLAGKNMPKEAMAPDADPEWSRSLSDQIARAFVRVHAVLEERQVPFREIHRFLAGETIELMCESLTRVRFDAEDNPAFWCELGKNGNELSLRIEREFDADELAREEI